MTHRPSLSWQVVAIIAALLVTMNVVIVYADDVPSTIGPFANMLGIILVAIFAKNGYDTSVRAKNESVQARNEVQQIKEDVNATAEHIFNLVDDPEHVRTVRRIEELEQRLQERNGN